MYLFSRPSIGGWGGCCAPPTTIFGVAMTDEELMQEYEDWIEWLKWMEDFDMDNQIEDDEAGEYFDYYNE